MQIVYTGQTNVIALPIVAKTNGDPITAGTVNFYLKALTGDNAGKWYRGSDQTWQASESIAGSATHGGDGHWELSLGYAVWTKDVHYLAYAKESGDLHIPVEKDILCWSEKTKKMVAWDFGIWKDKPGVPGTYQILDPDDGITVIAEIITSTDSPYKQVNIL